MILFYVIGSKCKWVCGVDTYEAEITADSIIWELFAKKSTEYLNLRNLNKKNFTSFFLTFQHWNTSTPSPRHPLQLVMTTTKIRIVSAQADREFQFLGVTIITPMRIEYGNLNVHLYGLLGQW